MSVFSRGITNQSFITALNKMYNDEKSFWNKMINDKDLFIAIRDNYINVYFRGNSICKLSFNGSDIVGETHYKYLLQPNLKKEYEKSTNGEFSLENTSKYFITSLNDLSAIKKSSLAYSGEEKTGVHSISIKEKNVIDVEITFSLEDRKTDRIDYLKLEETKGNLKLVFYEAKHFKNSGNRATKDDKNVLGQLKRYEKALIDHEKEIINSYKAVCKNLQELNLLKSNNDKFIKRVSAGEDVSIDYHPKLIIFGFDQDQKEGMNWKKHHDNLMDKLDKRLILKGNV